MTESIKLINSMMPWYFPTVAFLFGACIGSFLNVCIYRIPAGKSVIRPASHCACGAPIKWFDNVPILSWFILRGRARCCGSPFSFRYPAVEALTGLVFLGCWMQAPGVGVALSWMLFCSLMIVAAFVDLDTMTIPNRCSVGGFAAGLILSVIVPELHSAGRATLEPFQALILSLKGAFIGTALIYWIMSLANLLLRRNTMGLGDVELLGAIGAFCGWQGAVFALFGGALLGTLAMVSWAVARLILGKGLPEIPAPTVPDGQEDSGEEVPEGAIPFGPALAAGAVCYLLFARDIVTTYFDQMEFLLLR